jgi:hypothetical protein
MKEPLVVPTKFLAPTGGIISAHPDRCHPPGSEVTCTNASTNQEAFSCPNKIYSSHWGYHCLYMADPITKLNAIDKKQLFLHVILKSRSQVNFKVTSIHVKIVHENWKRSLGRCGSSGLGKWANTIALPLRGS